MPMRADVRSTRRAFLFAYLGPLLGPLLPRCTLLTSPRLSIAGGLEWLICWRGSSGLRLAGAS